MSCYHRTAVLSSYHRTAVLFSYHRTAVLSSYHWTAVLFSYHWTAALQVLHVYRNPKDTVVSGWFHLKQRLFLEDMTLSQFVRKSVVGKGESGAVVSAVVVVVADVVWSL